MKSESEDQSGLLVGGPSVGERLAPHLAEYEALRKEIEWLLKGATQYQNFCIILIGTLATLGVWLADKQKDLLIPFLLAASMLFAALGFLYFRQHQEVFVAASYIKNSLRPLVRKMLSDDTVWLWEDYKESRNQNSNLFLRPQFIVLFRVAIFLFPSALSILFVFGDVIGMGLKNIQNSYSTFTVYLVAIWMVVDVATVIAFILYVFAKGDLSRQLFADVKSMTSL